MGLDQAILKMDQKTYDLMKEWEARDWEDPEPDIAEPSERLWVGRKENHIQGYLDKVLSGVENMAYQQITKEQFAELTRRVREVDEDHTKAHRLLPPERGFFFGSTNLDEYYFSDIATEREAFEEILKDWDDAAVYAYWAWW